MSSSPWAVPRSVSRPPGSASACVGATGAQPRAAPERTVAEAAGGKDDGSDGLPPEPADWRWAIAQLGEPQDSAGPATGAHRARLETESTEVLALTSEGRSVAGKAQAPIAVPMANR